MEKDFVGKYLNEIARYFSDSQSSEMSYRTAFQNYLETIFPVADKYVVQHDQKAVAGNKPDFIVRRGDIPLLYIEVKPVGTDLDKVEKSSQATRYFGYTNLIISDYCEFRFYRNGERYSLPIKFAEANEKTHHFAPKAEQGEYLERTIREFIESQKEPIKSGKHLAKIMGGKALRIRENVIAFLERESSDKDELVRMMRFIEDHLIANFGKEEFADMYAQTLVYGLFAARYNDPSLGDFTREEARALIPATNPFLQKFFDHISGASFPKPLVIIVNELCEVFSHADVKELMEEYFKITSLFGDEYESPDPVIHFYEDFLREYDEKKKMEMGVFYTPLPVVRFIIRGIDDILKKEFGMQKGLADNSKTTITVEETHKGKKVKDKKEVHRLQMLDFATGTGTFLNETIAHIHDTFKGNEGRWASYVVDDLLPRLHGFELMMASYTIAHLKLAMTLSKSGITEYKKRLGVYLTNTLDTPRDIELQSSLFGIVESIAEESKLASQVKKEQPIMVVMGNPPYSGLSQNKHYTENEVYKVEPGGKAKLKEKKTWLDDDYVKFIRFAESMIEKNGEGVIGLITAHGYIDNPTFRGMRWHLRKTFDTIYVLDLHGNSNKKETAPDGGKDENVFDIKTGVAIIFGVKKMHDEKKGRRLAQVYQTDLYGARKEKFSSLTKGSISNIEWNKLPEETEVWKVEGKGKNKYQEGFSVAELFPKNTTGIVTARDSVVIDISKEELLKRIETFADSEMNETQLRAYLFQDKKDGKYKAGDTRGWKLVEARKKIQHLNHAEQIKQIAYRPFDVRSCYYHSDMVDWGRFDFMEKFLGGMNIGLVVPRMMKEDFGAFVSDIIIAHKLVSAYDSNSIFPLYLYENGEKVPNLNGKILKEIESAVGTTVPEDILDYVYAVLHSPAYRKKYGEFLKSDFPRVPYPKDKDTFWKLVPLGTKLRNLHLLADSDVGNKITSFPVTGTDIVEKPVFKNGKVYINETQYWDGVSENVWNFYIGGYQPAQKYLKDRKGRKLTNAESENYEKMIVALSKTIEIMVEIDQII